MTPDRKNVLQMLHLIFSECVHNVASVIGYLLKKTHFIHKHNNSGFWKVIGWQSQLITTLVKQVRLPLLGFGEPATAHMPQLTRTCVMRQTPGLISTYFTFHPICTPSNEAIIRPDWLKMIILCASNWWHAAWYHCWSLCLLNSYWIQQHAKRFISTLKHTLSSTHQKKVEGQGSRYGYILASMLYVCKSV